MTRKLKFNLKTNSLVCGDADEWLQYIPTKSIDLIYIDPPFFSNKNYEIVWGNGFEVRSFGDRWQGGIRHYIEWMRPKIKEAHRVLKDTGSMLLHCDWHANHYLRVLLDEVFGYKNFRNEIIWHYFMGGKPKTFYARKHDNIYWYSKSKKWTFNYETKFRMLPKKPSLVSPKKMFEKGGVWYSEVGRDDVIDMSGVFNMSNEYIGYITQKPEKLIEQLVRQISNKNDVVLDFFGGGGTTAKVCADLNRKFIIGDVSPVAVRVTGDRLISYGYTDYEVKALPQTKEEWLLLDKHKFADMMCEFMGWESNPKKSGDGGIDGWANRGKIGLQIKNRENKTGTPDIREFIGSLEAIGLKQGIVVSWAFSSSACEFKAKIKSKGFEIEFVEVESILGSLLLPKDKRIKQQQYYKERVKMSKLMPMRLFEKPPKKKEVS